MSSRAGLVQNNEPWHCWFRWLNQSVISHVRMFIYVISNQVGIVVVGLVLSCTALLGVSHAQRIHSFFSHILLHLIFSFSLLAVMVTQGNTAVHIWLHSSTAILQIPYLRSGQRRGCDRLTIYNTWQQCVAHLSNMNLWLIKQLLLSCCVKDLRTLLHLSFCALQLSNQQINFNII